MNAELEVQFFQKWSLRRMRREWWWRAVHTNTNIMAGSLQGYSRLVDCEAAERTVSNRLATASKKWIYADGTVMTTRRIDG